MLTKGKQIAYVPMSVIEAIGLSSVNQDTIKDKAGVKYGFIMGPASPVMSADGIAYYICHYWEKDGKVDKIPSYTPEHFILELDPDYVPQERVNEAMDEILIDMRD